MTLRRQLTKAGTLLVLAALVVLFIFGAAVILGFYSQSHSQRFVQLDANAPAAEGIMQEGLSPEETAQALSGLGYELVVTKEKAVLFSNLREYQERVLTAASSAGWVSGEDQYLLVDGVTIVKVVREDASFMALHDASSVRRHFTLTEVFLLSYLTMGLLTIALIVIVYNRISNQLLHRLLTPVDVLVDAAERVGAGDLSRPVVNEAPGELAPVIEAFNEMQRNLLSERERMAAYEKSRADLMAGISHDLRTPLTAVKGYIKGLRDGVANTPEKQARYLEVAYRRAGDMEALLHRLFLLSRMETGSLELNLEEVELEELLQSLVSDLKKELALKYISIEFEADGGRHTARVDVELLTRAMVNLAENAVKYAKADPLELKVVLRSEADGEHLLFSDNGQGVAEEEIPRLFEEFWRGDAARFGGRKNGSGLGLYIVQYIAQLHGGNVRAFNQDGLVIEMMFPKGADEAVLL